MMFCKYWKGELEFLLIFLFTMGKFLGIFRFTLNKQKNCVVKSKLLKIYSLTIWIVILINMPLTFHIELFREILKAVNDANGLFLIQVLNWILFVITYGTYLVIFFCIFFGCFDIKDLINEGFDLYEMIKKFKVSKAPFTKQIFRKIFIKIFVLDISITLLTFLFIFVEDQNIVKFVFTVYYSLVFNYGVNIFIAILLYSTYLFKLMSQKLLDIKKSLAESPKHRVDFHQILRFHHDILQFMKKIYKLLRTLLLFYFFYVFVSFINNVILIFNFYLYRDKSFFFQLPAFYWLC